MQNVQQKRNLTQRKVYVVEPVSNADVFVRDESVSVVDGHCFPPVGRQSLVQQESVAFAERQLALRASAKVVQSDRFLHVTLYSTTTANSLAASSIEELILLTEKGPKTATDIVVRVRSHIGCQLLRCALLSPVTAVLCVAV